MGRKQRNKQADPPSLADIKKRKFEDDSNAKSKRPKKENANATKLKGQRVNGKLVVPPKTRVAGKLVKPAQTTSSDKQSKTQSIDDFASFGDDEDDVSDSSENEGEDEGSSTVAASRSDKAALFDSESEADDDDGSDKEGDEEDVMLTDEEDDDRAGLFSDDSDDEDILTAANMAAMSRQLDEEEEEDEALADAELREPGMAAPQVLPTSDQEAADGENEDLTIVSSRLQEIVRVLADFKTLAEPGKSRQDYTKQFAKDVITYFGYSEYLAGRFLDFFSPAEALAFFEANETPRPMVIRVNTLKTSKRDLSKALIDRGINLGEVGKWTKCALQIFESSISIGATTEYLAGHYILQAASSLLPVLALKPESGDKVLDMAAAPGGKTSFLAQEMKNGGVIIANEVSKKRQKSLVANVVRMGCRNVISVGFDGRDFGSGKASMGSFDKILLDAPCSGTGVIHKDPSVKTNRTEKDFQVVSQLQRQLLLSAIDSLKVDGVVVYSTCSVMIDENEMVVDYALRNRNVKLEKIEVAIGEEGLVTYKDKRFHPSMNLTKRLYPHVHNMDGFFVSRLRKLGNEKAATPAVVKNMAKAESELGATTTDEANQDTPHGQQGGSLFKDEEDAALIAEGRRQQLRAKGHRPDTKRPSNGESSSPANKPVTTSEQTTTKDQALQSAKVLRKPAFKKQSKNKPKIIDYSKPQN